MLKIENLSLRLGNFALQDINLHVRKGEYFVLLGKPGAGKTVLLECLCGLVRPQTGRIFIDGTDATNAEPRQRKIGYVPQDYALFTHKTVKGNVAFGLRLKKDLSPRQRQQRVRELAQLFGIEHLLARSVMKLSGGEKQRVALARCLAVSPRVLLLDEPVSALDEQSRETVCMELKQLQQDTGTTIIHICHDLEEMLLVADHVGIIEQGKILQVGTPDELTEKPGTVEIARFLRCENVFTGQAQTQNNRTHITAGGRSILCSELAQGKISFMVRPEKISFLGDADAAGEENVFAGKVLRIINKGALVRVDVDAGLTFVTLVGRKQFEALNLKNANTVRLSFSARAVHLFKPQWSAHSSYPRQAAAAE